MRYIGIGYNQQYAISLCLKTMRYLYNMWNVKGFSNQRGIISPLGISYARKHHMNGNKKTRSCMGLANWVQNFETNVDELFFLAAHTAVGQALLAMQWCFMYANGKAVRSVETRFVPTTAECIVQNTVAQDQQDQHFSDGCAAFVGETPWLPLRRSGLDRVSGFSPKVAMLWW